MQDQENRTAIAAPEFDEARETMVRIAAKCHAGLKAYDDAALTLNKDASTARLRARATACRLIIRETLEELAKVDSIATTLDRMVEISAEHDARRALATGGAERGTA